MRTVDGRGFRDGVIATAPLHLAVFPFGLVFGVLAVEIGLTELQAMAMTTVVIAGASQFAALQLLEDGAPALLIIFTGAAVNLRMAMYAASIAPHWRGAPLWLRAAGAFCLHDHAFALAMRRYVERPAEPVETKISFYLGVGTATCFTWIASSYVGIRLGAAVPASWSLDFAVPIAFIAVIAPMLRSAPHVAAAMAGALTSLALIWLPFSLGVLVGGAVGIVAGAALETWISRAGHPAEGERPGDPDRSADRLGEEGAR